MRLATETGSSRHGDRHEKRSHEQNRIACAAVRAVTDTRIKLRD